MKRGLLYTLVLLFATLQTFAQTYTYDKNSRLTKVTYGNGVTVSYTYDELGNRTGKQVTGASTTTYTITVSVTPTGSGSVTGGGTYSKGTLVELNAVPNAGYEFSKWSDGVTTNPRTVTVTKNQSFTAQFVQSTVIPELTGDIVVDGKVNLQDLSALVNAYLNNTQVTQVTDLDSDGSLTIADISTLISIINENSSGDINGHEYVNLGLPSGTLWATCNIGASSPQGYGCYYAWGETSGSCEEKTTFSLSTYCYYNGSEMTKYLEKGCVLEPVDDAATSNWGGEWRMPTYSEIQELINSKYTTSEWTTENGVNGYRITSIVKGFEGKSIFLPAAGWYTRTDLKDVGSKGKYWTSTLRSGSDESYAYVGYLLLDSTGPIKGSTVRYYGFPIRPVVSLKSIQ